MRGRSWDRRPGPPWWFDPEHRRFAGDRHARARYFRRWGMGGAVLFIPAVSVSVIGGLRLAERLGLSGWIAGVPPLLMLAAVFALAVTFVRMRGFVGPLRHVMEAADRVADGDYSVRVAAQHGAPPIRALAHSFNTMTARLQDADRLRRDLMADVAHELRTPLSVLQGRLEGLIDGVYPQDQAQLEQLLEETHVLSRLVEDLRTLALSEAGALPLQKEPTDIVALAQDVIRSMQGRGASLDAPGGGAVTVDVDPVRIREVLTNLLANAIRHTPNDGRVAVTVDDRSDRVIVTVTDTGEGIPQQDVERLFDRFYKGAESRGSGLGLAIAKGIVAAHGGEIHASSKVGEGTTIDFTLPR